MDIYLFTKSVNRCSKLRVVGQWSLNGDFVYFDGYVYFDLGN